MNSAYVCGAAQFTCVPGSCVWWYYTIYICSQCTCVHGIRVCTVHTHAGAARCYMSWCCMVYTHARCMCALVLLHTCAQRMCLCCMGHMRAQCIHVCVLHGMYVQGSQMCYMLQTLHRQQNNRAYRAPQTSGSYLRFNEGASHTQNSCLGPTCEVLRSIPFRSCSLLPTLTPASVRHT